MAALKFEYRGRRYRVITDDAARIQGAWVYVQPHDKMPSWRRVHSPVTLRILGEHLNPTNTCPACGQLLTKE